MLNGYFGYANGVKVTGTMANRSNTYFVPTGARQTIASGYYDGTGYVEAVSVPVANVLAGTTIAGQAGTMPEYYNTWGVSTTVYTDGAGNIYLYPPNGHYDGSRGIGQTGGVRYNDPDFIATNLKAGVNVLGLVGTLESTPVKSVQRGVTSAFNDNVTTTLDVTIANVDMTKSILRVYGSKYNGVGGSNGPAYESFAITFINSTTIRISKLSASTIDNIVWEVIEFNNVKSLQTGTKVVADGATNTDITISSVNPAKSLAFVSWTTPNNNTDTRAQYISPYISSSTNLHIYTPSYYGHTYYWQVIEFN